ncbi:hypothetical protein BK809_0001485 [Diplodia seriata]|uniref:Uncharacterized protein n=1 Tax=Diplodia seriata TaxID=420778 RepID=A0A1S8B973_9PEZI|nr:hypothetical protein BK809_0001485 [Diplodia seriata]
MLDFSMFMNTVGLDFDLGIISEPLWNGGESAAVGGPIDPGDLSAADKEREKPRRIPDASIGDGDQLHSRRMLQLTDSRAQMTSTN